MFLNLDKFQSGANLFSTSLWSVIMFVIVANDANAVIFFFFTTVCFCLVALQLVDLFLNMDWSAYLADYGTPKSQYPQVRPWQVARVLCRLVNALTLYIGCLFHVVVLG